MMTDDENDGPELVDDNGLTASNRAFNFWSARINADRERIAKELGEKRDRRRDDQVAHAPPAAPFEPFRILLADAVEAYRAYRVLVPQVAFRSSVALSVKRTYDRIRQLTANIARQVYFDPSLMAIVNECADTAIIEAVNKALEVHREHTEPRAW